MKKNKKPGRLGVFKRLAALYDQMAAAYSAKAEEAGLTCANCEQNCCTSYFQHHTYIEWTYLWKGMNELPQEKREEYLSRAREAVHQYDIARSHGVLPKVMCPLNDEGLCGLYKHRLMICRMHGTRNILQPPNGSDRKVFTGCYRFVDQVKNMPEEQIPTVDRTPLYMELVKLEMEYVGPRLKVLPRVNMTLAEMLVNGPPVIR